MTLTRSIALILVLTCFTLPVHADLMLVGIDEKMDFVDGATVMRPPGNDRVLVYDISTPETPELTGSLDLSNSIYGPPTNLIITPDERLGLVANPMQWVHEDGEWTAVPDTKLHLIDLSGPPRHLTTIEVGRQPSGMDLTPDGSLLLIGNRAEPTITVLAIDGISARVIDTVTVSNPVDAVSITPDGQRAVFTMRTADSIGFLHISGTTVTYDAGEDITVGIEPYNVAVSPTGEIAIVNNAGRTGGNDGHVDPVCVIDLTTGHPFISDWVAVGDGPEGLAFSPDGSLAVAVLINGSQNAAAPWAANENGRIAVLAVNGTSVEKVQDIEVGGMPEGIVFSPDGSHVYVGNFTTDDMTVLRVQNGSIQPTGAILELPGSPASMR